MCEINMLKTKYTTPLHDIIDIYGNKNYLNKNKYYNLSNGLDIYNNSPSDLGIYNNSPSDLGIYNNSPSVGINSLHIDNDSRMTHNNNLSLWFRILLIIFSMQLISSDTNLRNINSASMLTMISRRNITLLLIMTTIVSSLISWQAMIMSGVVTIMVIVAMYYLTILPLAFIAALFAMMFVIPSKYSNVLLAICGCILIYAVASAIYSLFSCVYTLCGGVLNVFI